MASRVVSELIQAAGAGIGGVLRQGRILPIAAGALIGCFFGYTSSVSYHIPMFPLLLLGALAGATLAAAFFPRPSPSKDDRRNKTE